MIQRRMGPRGTILIVAMIIIFALASLALVLGQSVRVEATAAANQLAAHQAAAVARAAEQYVLALLTEQADSLHELDERYFAAIPIGEGFFWIVRPDYQDPALPRYGLLDETSKLDVNVISLDSLRSLPGMTEELAAAIVDWRDEDDDVTPGGAESQTYLAQPQPYRAKNGPFETVEELLLVRGMSADLLYGLGTSVPLGDAATAQPSRPYTSEIWQQRGMFDLFTVWSRVTNLASDGSRRISINDQRQRSDLRRMLRTRLGDARGSEVAARIPPGNITDIFEFARTLQLEISEFEQIEHYIHADRSGRDRRGRINVNSAPRDVLLCVDGLDSADVETLLARRASAAAANPNSIAWVLDALQEKAVGLGTRITARGRHYSADIVAVSGNGRAFKRVRIVVDTPTSGPRIVYRRDQTDLGWPMERSIIESLRAGMR